MTEPSRRLAAAASPSKQTLTRNPRLTTINRGLFCFLDLRMRKFLWLLLLVSMLAAGCEGEKPTGKFKDQDKPKPSERE